MSNNQFTVGDQVNYDQGKEDSQKKSDEMKKELMDTKDKSNDNKKDDKMTDDTKTTDSKTKDQKDDQKKDSQTSEEDVNGELTYDDKVIQKIIGIAMKEVDGLLTINGGFFSNMRDKLVNSDNVAEGINTEVGKKQVAVDMDIVAEYGKDIDEVYENIKKLIVREVKTMTHLDVIEVNVNVIDIQTREEFEAAQESLQDKAEEAMSDREKEQAKKKEEKTEDKEENKSEDNSRVE